MKLKVLHIIPSLNKGGAERLVLDICNELHKRENLEVVLITFSDKNEYPFLSNNINWKIIPSRVVPSMKMNPIIEIDELNKFILLFKPNNIHSHLFEGEIVSRWKLIENTAYVTHCHDNMKQFKNFSFATIIKKKSVTNFYEKQILLKQYKKCNNHFIVISKDTRNYFRKTLPLRLSQNIHTFPNAINFERFYNLENTKHEIDKYEFVKLISVGSLTDKKNQIFLIDVVKKLHFKKYKIKLDLLGEGNNKVILEKRIFKYNLQNYISLKGNVLNVEDYLHEADIYVHSSLEEPFGLVILEAMAAGLPVVTLDGKGNRDLIEQSKNGFMVYEQNAELFAEKIIELIENKGLYQTMSTYAVEFARKYDIKEYVDNLIELYRSI